MKTVSEVTGKIYENEDVVFYRNPAQSAFMISKGAKLIDIFVDSKMKFVFVFDPLFSIYFSAPTKFLSFHYSQLLHLEHPHL